MIVLFSNRDRCWKLGDLGTVADGTSKHFDTTRYSRGSACYRAPEVLDWPARYNNKADIWALGCIIHELATGEKAFHNDRDTENYSSKIPRLLRLWTRSLDDHPILLPVRGVTREYYTWFYGGLQSKVREMLNGDPHLRPGAKDLAEDWELLESLLRFVEDFEEVLSH